MRKLIGCALAGFLLGCSPDLRGMGADYQLLVFPGEAELGGSAAAIIGSNYVPGADAFEDYQLERSRVGVQITDALGVDYDATVRAVFPIAAPANSYLAQERPGTWITVVLFDLPTNAAIDLGTGPPFLADVVVKIDGVQQLENEQIGSIRITGRGGPGIGGEPTTIYYPAIEEFELRSLVMRLRPALDHASTGDGFPVDPEGTTIGGLEADVVYFSPCLKSPVPAMGTEATDAGWYMGPTKVHSLGGGWLSYNHLVITHPAGFTLEPPPGGAPEALGEGPLIDIGFVRPPPGAVSCSGLMAWLWNVYVVAPDGSTIVDQRGTAALNESSDLFSLHPIATE